MKRLYEVVVVFGGEEYAGEPPRSYIVQRPSVAQAIAPALECAKRDGVIKPRITEITEMGVLAG